MRPLVILAVLLAAVLAHVPAAAQKKAEEAEPADWRLYKTTGRSWSILRTETETSKTITETRKVLEAKQDSARFEWTESFFKDGDKDTVWTTTLLFNAHPGNMKFIQAPDGTKQEKGELVEVKAGKFFCDVYKKGAGKRAEYWYMSQHMPGLIVKSTTKKETSELITFTKMTGDPDLAIEKLTPEQKKQRDWALFMKKDRAWTFKKTSVIAGKTITTYMSYEVTGVGANFANYTFKQLDSGKRLVGKAVPSKVEFTAENAKMWGITPWDTWTLLREEEVEAAGKKWPCIVYEDKKTIEDATMTMWYSKDFPGLGVKITCKGKYNDSEDILHEWKE